MPFHLLITRGAHTVYRFNVDEEWLADRVVGPWERGDPIVLQGEEWPPQFSRFTIVESNAVPEDLGGRQAWNDFVAGGRLATDDFLNEPIGSKAPMRSQSAPEQASQPQAQTLSETTTSVNRRNVVVIYGRDEAARNGLFTFLRALDLLPLEWSQLVASTGEGSPYVGQVLDRAFAIAQAAVVLFTPDDETRLRQALWREDEQAEETELRWQARPNVFFEAGLAFGRFPARTLLIQMGAPRGASDLSGRHVLRMNDSPERSSELAQRLEQAGCAVVRSGTDWLSAGSLTATGI